MVKLIKVIKICQGCGKEQNVNEIQPYELWVQEVDKDYKASTVIHICYNCLKKLQYKINNNDFLELFK